MQRVRVALYARVSTRDKEQDPETQLYALRAWAEGQGHTIAAEYVDKASAADYRQRTAWRQLLASAREGGWDAVAALRIDRIARSVYDLHSQLQTLQSYGKGFIATTQPEVNTASSYGKLMLNLLAAFAEFERDILRERTREGIARAKAQGKPIGKRGKDKGKRKKAGYYGRWEGKNG